MTRTWDCTTGLLSRTTESEALIGAVFMVLVVTKAPTSILQNHINTFYVWFMHITYPCSVRSYVFQEKWILYIKKTLFLLTKQSLPHVECSAWRGERIKARPYSNTPTDSYSSKSHLVSNCITGEPHASGRRYTRYRHHALCDLCGWLNCAPVPLLPKNITKDLDRAFPQAMFHPSVIFIIIQSSSSFIFILTSYLRESKKNGDWFYCRVTACC